MSVDRPVGRQRLDDGNSPPSPVGGGGKGGSSSRVPGGPAANGRWLRTADVYAIYVNGPVHDAFYDVAANPFNLTLMVSANECFPGAGPSLLTWRPACIGSQKPPDAERGRAWSGPPRSRQPIPPSLPRKRRSRASPGSDGIQLGLRELVGLR